MKNNPGNGLITFTAASTIVSAQYAFVWYSAAASTYRTPKFEFFDDVVIYNITPARNDPSGGTVSLFGNVITATPAACYTYANPAYTVSPAGAADVSQSGDAFTVTNLTNNVTVTINFMALPIYTVSFKDKGETFGSSMQTNCGKITLPAGPASCADWQFIGWAKTSVGQTTTKPTVYSAGTVYTPAADDEKEITVIHYSRFCLCSVIGATAR